MKKDEHCDHSKKKVSVPVDGLPMDVAPRTRKEDTAHVDDT